MRVFEAPSPDGKPRKRHAVRGGSFKTLCEKPVAETWCEVPDTEPTCKPCINELAEARARVTDDLQRHLDEQRRQREAADAEAIRTTGKPVRPSAEHRWNDDPGYEPHWCPPGHCGLCDGYG